MKTTKVTVGSQCERVRDTTTDPSKESNGVLVPGISPNVKVEVNNNHTCHLNFKEEGKSPPSLQIKKEYGRSHVAGNEFGHENCSSYSNPEKVEAKPSSCFHSGDIMKESKENLLSCYVKSEVSVSDTSNASVSKPVHHRAISKQANEARSNVLRVIEEYFYLESKYLNFSENGEKFACTLCPTEYLSHGVMLSHLLGSKHMETFWTSKQTSASIIEKVEKLASLVPLMKKGAATDVIAYNPLSIYDTAQRLDKLLLKLVKKGSPCLPGTLQQAFYLCDCIMDCAAEDGQLQNYIPKRKVNFIKTGEFFLGQKVKLEQKVEGGKVNCKVMLKKEF
ncbi:uncharacterized protein LOC113206004 isoform X1 [Frankliniella occidentalis]|uniref:Uncharacterized protein LOC113206004 isoform X1 n=1 Tax=Frankliniella occidentalis TaxID=133901 RepID=A0A6J1SEB9_FRAOC|nr:uncharacterized protein LOC113206004 isoform X1 [Frankliniella occidentalis]XP_052126989.1 uncharacterized protein LOC113206004 isoform X1 [Frankliniella occidentalis]